MNDPLAPKDSRAFFFFKRVALSKEERSILSLSLSLSDVRTNEPTKEGRNGPRERERARERETLSTGRQKTLFGRTYARSLGRDAALRDRAQH